MEKYHRAFNIFLFCILFVKIVYIGCMFAGVYINRGYNNDLKLQLETCKEYLHVVFTMSMGVLLILLFSNLINKGEVCVDGHLKVYLSTFGILSLLEFIRN
jgi:hypothetical protein